MAESVESWHHISTAATVQDGKSRRNNINRLIIII